MSKSVKRERDTKTSPSSRKKKKDETTEVILPAPDWFNARRVRSITANSEPKQDGDCVVYWMSRDQRSKDNWALLYARYLAQSKGVPLKVAFCLVPRFLEATIRHFGFMIRGLAEVESSLLQKNIPFHLLQGYAVEVLPQFLAETNACAVVTDMSPLRVPRKWVSETAEKLTDTGIPLFQADAHNIVPIWVASDKQEYGARTIRPKIHRNLPEFLTPFPELDPNPEELDFEFPSRIDWDAIMDSLEVDRTVEEVRWLRPGMAAGEAMLQEFCETRLKIFGDKRNNPNEHALSNLSPYFHFGQLSVQTAINTVRKYSSKYNSSVQSFVEEAVVRRELSDNYCYYQENYDNLDGCYEWARKTLEDHRNDTREYIYTLEQLEQSKTHDDLWNAAQKQLVTEGKMHGFLRMYWAKKILEWTPDPDTALQQSIYLNDRYSLDGRDPNGYVGCAWSIMGIHDQGWREREVFGKIRYMNYAGCKRKFDVPKFVSRYASEKEKVNFSTAKEAKARSKKGAVPKTKGKNKKG